MRYLETGTAWRYKISIWALGAFVYLVVLGLALDYFGIELKSGGVAGDIYGFGWLVGFILGWMFAIPAFLFSFILNADSYLLRAVLVCVSGFAISFGLDRALASRARRRAVRPTERP